MSTWKSWKPQKRPPNREFPQAVQTCGRQTQILVEGPSRQNEARMAGRTRCNKIVVFDGSERHRGLLLDVKITRVGSFTLYGDPAVVNL